MISFGLAGLGLRGAIKASCGCLEGFIDPRLMNSVMISVFFSGFFCLQRKVLGSETRDVTKP